MKKQSFEALMTEIDQLVQKLENPSTGLEESLQLFEAGSQLITQARSRLRTVEHEFETLQQKFGEEPSPEESSSTPREQPQESLDL